MPLRHRLAGSAPCRKPIPAARCALLIAIASLLMACADGSDTAQKPPPVDQPAELVLQITFPPAGSFTAGTEQLTASGTVVNAANRDLDAEDIASLTVNGVAAEVDLTAGRWQATIPVQRGHIDITAVVEGGDGQVERDSITIDNHPEPLDYDLVGITPDGNTLYVMDADYGGILRRIDLTNLEETMVTSNADDDERIWAFGGIRIDAAALNAYLLAYPDEFFNEAPQVVSVDLVEGMVQARGRLPLAQGRYEEYPDFDLDEQASRVIASFRGDLENEYEDECRLVTVDLNSGETTTLLRTYSLSGPPGNFVPELCPGALVADALSARVITTADFRDEKWVDDPDFNGVYAYDIETGERSTLSDASTGIGTGPALSSPKRLFRTRQHDTVVTLDDAGVLVVNTSNGDRKLLLAKPDIPENTTDIAFDELNNRLIIASDSNTISALDLETNELSEILGFSRAIGTGPDIDFSSLLLVDSTNQRLLALDSRQNALIEIDLETLDRRVLAADIGVNDTFRMSVSAATLNSDGTRLYYAIDKSFISQPPRSDIRMVNLQTAEVQLVSSYNSASGPDLKYTRSLSLDEAKELLYLTGAYDRVATFGVLSVDITTGTRNLISHHTQGPDAIRADFTAHLQDDAAERLIAVTREGAITSISLADGSREILVTPATDQQALAIRNAMTWDSKMDSILVMTRSSQPWRLELQSVNVSTGERSVVKDDVINFAFDANSALIYTIRGSEHKQGDARVMAMDRFHDGEAAIAHPE